MRSEGALDISAFFEKQIAWLHALSLEAAQGNGQVVGYINLFVRRFVAELRQRLSCLEKFTCLFVQKTDLTVANSIQKSWRSLARAPQRPVTVRNCILCEADLQRIAHHETDAIPWELIDE